ncbi:carbohydrate ABC transporter permease [Asanoa iriomotensis]|uniref:ABC transporter permease n=1 Tax=Asanoa iriomotensis TaxID=234613 RepID=A0ABQ4C0B3_9ACTN|nr:carbohydrate ABC transporter permease [Asanoa iriomotensis]GIF55735.1 ABC transporter permease [Asanoa iriomotensis]
MSRVRTPRPATFVKGIVLVVILAWVLLPIYFLFAVALTPTGTTLDGFSVPDVLTFENFMSVLNGINVIWPALVNSVIVTVAATVIALLFAVPAAYALSHLKHKRVGRGLYMSTFVLRGVPPVALVLPYYVIFSKAQLINTMPGVIVALVPLALPYCIWTMRVFFDAVPPQVEEAAGVDGAGVWRTFRSVVLPIARPGIAATGILAALLVFVDYIVVATLAGPATMTFPVYVTTFQQDYLSLVGPLAAASIVGALPMLLMFGFSQRYMLRLANAGVH